MFPMFYWKIHIQYNLNSISNNLENGDEGRLMNKTNKCLKDWNAIIEALGQGKQTILIRNYKTNLTKFLLYPTVSYAMKKDYLESFQGKYQGFVKSNSFPEKEGNNVLIKYFATVENIVEKRASRIPSDKHFIWTRDHVKRYINKESLFVWILRVYSLENSYWAEPSPRAIKYANLKENISLEGVAPVLSDSEFGKVLKNL